MPSIKEILLEKKAIERPRQFTVPAFYKKSFLFVRSTETVNTPGELIQELFRESFFENRFETKTKVRLNPNGEEVLKSNYSKCSSFKPYGVQEQVALEIFRGRKMKGGKGEYSYLPPYPSLARNAWNRENAGRQIKLQFLGGAIAQAFESILNPSSRDEEVLEFSTQLYKALAGTNKEEIIFKLISDYVSCSVLDDNSEIIRKIKNDIIGEFDAKDRLEADPANIYHLPREFVAIDKLPSQILHDTRIILGLEKDIPRIEWINVLTTYIRIAIPSWVLSQAKNSIIFSKHMYKAIDDKRLVEEKELFNEFSTRNQRLFICSETVNDGGNNLIVEYTRSRIEVGILFHILEKMYPDKFLKKHLDIDMEGSSVLKVHDLLSFLISEAKNIKSYLNIEQGTIEQAIKREAEYFNIWVNPINNKGIGKNMNYLLNGLKQMNSNDFDEGALLLPKIKGNIILGYNVFPHPMLIKLFCFLAQKSKNEKGETLVYKDLIDHFSIYGIDFTSSGQASNQLISELLRLGYLTSSKDAGYNALIKTIY